MHAAERERAITDILKARGFIAFRDLETLIDASPATLRRDLERLAVSGRLERVHGGARLAEPKAEEPQQLSGAPFHVNININPRQKAAIGAAAARLCVAGEGVMINGGSTTLQMCEHLDGLNLQVLTNSLHIVNALAGQVGTRILVPGGALFKEQNIILSTRGEDNMPRFYAPKLFLGAASVGAGGVMEPDPVLVNSDRRFIERAEEIILLVDSSKFQGLSGHVVCDLDEIDVVVTDDGIEDRHAQTLERAGVRLIVA
ncbi:MAG: DeoR family transcriptional regulator [Caulobacteraceae bacterium]|nr:DeoR family transcriptional regulator [Caulobacteraceae bacterium]